VNENPPCRICGETPYPPTPDGICSKCRGATPGDISAREYARKAREREQGPIHDARRKLPCLRCGNLELIHARIRERGAREISHQPLSPFAVTFAAGIQQEVGKLPPPTPIGFFNAYICRACGYVEWYVDHPGDIPIGPEYYTELVQAEQVRLETVKIVSKTPVEAKPKDEEVPAEEGKSTGEERDLEAPRPDQSTSSTPGEGQDSGTSQDHSE
jgi:hypothetical protein